MNPFRLFVLVACLSAAPLTASAHAHLRQSEPANDSALTAAPAHFMLTFSESAHLTSLTLQKEGDATAQKIAGLPKDASDHFSIPAPRLAAGVYTLKFRNVATGDSHISAGSIRFTVMPAARPAASVGK